MNAGHRQFFCGQNIGETPKIVVIGTNKLGLLICMLPLLAALRKKYPQAEIAYLGCTEFSSLEEQLALFNYRFPLYVGIPEDSSANGKLDRFLEKIGIDNGNPADLVLDMDFFSQTNLSALNQIQTKYIVSRNAKIYSPLLLERDKIRWSLLHDARWERLRGNISFCKWLSTGHITEVYGLLFLVSPTQYDFGKPDLPRASEVIISPQASRNAKQWPTRLWCDLIDRLDPLFKAGFFRRLTFVGTNSNNNDNHFNYEQLIKHAFSTSLTEVVNLRGKTNILNLIEIVSSAKLLLTVESGVMHVGIAVKTPTVVLIGNDVNKIGASPENLWIPPQVNKLYFARTKHHCSLCLDNKFKNNECLLPKHECMNNLSVKSVMLSISHALKPSA